METKEIRALIDAKKAELRALELQLRDAEIAGSQSHERGLVHDEPLADSVTGGFRDATTDALDNFTLKKALFAAARRGEERMRERAALALEAEATCDCQGKAGRCLINDPPREFATIIRALPLTPEPGQ